MSWIKYTPSASEIVLIVLVANSNPHVFSVLAFSMLPLVPPKSILWNLSMKDGNIAQVSYRSPYDIMAKEPKTGEIKTLLAVWYEVGTSYYIT